MDRVAPSSLSLASLQLVLDEPPEVLYNKWIKERMEFYKRVEPCAAPRDERLELVGNEPPSEVQHQQQPRGSVRRHLASHSEQRGDQGHPGDPAGGPKGHGSGLRGHSVSEDAAGEWA